MRFILENTSKTKLPCPEAHCTKNLSYEGIRRILDIGNNKALFEKYDRQLTLHSLEQTAEFVWCAHPDCKSGQFHDTTNSARRRLICINCNKQTCSFHRIIWHTGLTCEQYDREQAAANDSTKEWIDLNTKQCPGCHQNIQKSGGCDHMTCTCGQQFCWKCLADQSRIIRSGLHHHKKTCSHYLPIWRSTTRSRDDYWLIHDSSESRTCTIL